MKEMVAIATGNYDFLLELEKIRNENKLLMDRIDELELRPIAQPIQEQEHYVAGRRVYKNREEYIAHKRSKKALAMKAIRLKAKKAKTEHPQQ